MKKTKIIPAIIMTVLLVIGCTNSTSPQDSLEISDFSELNLEEPGDQSDQDIQESVNPPELIINEIRTIFSNPRVEFIELKALSAGNLVALRLFATYESDEPLFVFPPVEVKKGEYIVIHTRSIEPGIVDETGTNLAASGGNEALPTARDFWIPGSLTLHDTNVIYLIDQGGRIIDGVVLVSSANTWKDSITTAAKELVKQGMWSGFQPEDAFNTDGNTATRTINRDETKQNTHSPADWYITVTGGATPGKANNTGRYK